MTSSQLTWGADLWDHDDMMTYVPVALGRDLCCCYGFRGTSDHMQRHWLPFEECHLGTWSTWEPDRGNSGHLWAKNGSCAVREARWPHTHKCLYGLPPKKATGSLWGCCESHVPWESPEVSRAIQTHWPGALRFPGEFWVSVRGPSSCQGFVKFTAWKPWVTLSIGKALLSLEFSEVLWPGQGRGPVLDSSSASC